MKFFRGIWSRVVSLGRFRKLWLHVALFVLMGLVAFSGFQINRGIVKAQNTYQENKRLAANFVIAEYAHLRAGEPIPLDGIEYDRSNISKEWGMETNVRWMTDQARLIVPYLIYEKATIGNGRYPYAFGLLPELGTRSMHIWGHAHPFRNVAFLNERMFFDGRWQDQANLMGTMTHELIHLQGGAYISGSPEEFEPATEAATTEVLAAMCNHGNDVACRAFWLAIHDSSRAVFWTELNERGYESWYQRISDLLWRDAEQSHAARKSMRYWAENPAHLQYILRAYSVKPWEKHVIPGLFGGKLNTQMLDACDCSQYFARVVGMPFDDTQYLMGNLIKIIEITYK